MKSYNFIVYNAGQGLCTALEGIMDNDEKYFAIFDCGTIQQGVNSPERIVNNIVSRANENGKIDGIVISHQDMDHWSMLLDIIWKYYNVQDNYVVCQDSFYLCRTGCKMYIYEKEENGIKYFHNYTGINCVLNSEVTLNPEGDIMDLCINAEYNENPGLGQCCLQLEGNRSVGELHLHVSIDRVWVETEGSYGNIVYNESFRIESNRLEFTDWNWPSIVYCIQENEIYRKVEKGIGFQKYFRAHYTNFISELWQISFRYQDMQSMLSQESNFNREKKPIGTVLMGGDFWEIGYIKLYGILKKLVDAGLVECVNGYRRDSAAEADGSERLSGLLRMNEDTFRNGIFLEEISVDENLLDPFSGVPTAGTPAILHNASSLVVEFTAQEREYLLLPGDATVHDFKSLAEKLEGREDSCTLLMAPHHGSDHTNYCYLPDGGTQPLTEMLKSLTSGDNVIDACIVSALADKFGHPGKRFTDDILEYVAEDMDDRHKVCYVQGGWMRKFETCRQFFCTETFQEMFEEWYPDDDDLMQHVDAPHINGGFI